LGQFFLAFSTIFFSCALSWWAGSLARFRAARLLAMYPIAIALNSGRRSSFGMVYFFGGGGGGMVFFGGYLGSMGLPGGVVDSSGLAI
jgi:hypothetical protein